MSLLNSVKCLLLDWGNRAENLKPEARHTNSNHSTKVSKVQITQNETTQNVDQEERWQQTSKKIACIGKVLLVGIILFGLGAALLTSMNIICLSSLNSETSVSFLSIPLSKKEIQRAKDLQLIEKHIPPYYLPKSHSHYSKFTNTMIGLLELKREHSDSYYIFTHGMSQTQTQITQFIGNIDHRLWPNRDSKDFIFSRVVSPYKKGTLLKDIFLKLKTQDDHDLRSELLSVDANLLNFYPTESALYYYLVNHNNFHDHSWIVCNVLGTFAQEFNMKFSQKNCRARIEFNSKWKLSIDDEDELGFILAYAIPKKLIDNPDTNFVYTSEPFGKPVDKDNPLAGFKELIKTPSSLEDVSVHPNNISARILTSHLRPENGIKNFILGEFNKKNNFYENQMQNLLKISEHFFQTVVDHCHFWEWSKNSFLDPSKKVNIECERLILELHLETAVKTSKHHL